jgi:MFS family permease
MAQRVGVRVVIAGGTTLIACGLLILAATQAGRPFALAQIGLIVAGIGMGLNTGPLMSVAVDAVSAARSGTASALINVARMAGATLGVAFLGTAFALWHGGAEGLRAAMLIGAAAQLCGVARCVDCDYLVCADLDEVLIRRWSLTVVRHLRT